MEQLEFLCPKCGSSRFGSSNELGTEMRHCHGDHCSYFSFPEADDWKYFTLVTRKRFKDKAEFDEYQKIERSKTYTGIVRNV